MATTPTAADILRHTTAFVHQLISQHDLRHRVLSSSLHRPAQCDKTTSRTLLLASQAVESAISASAASSSSPLRLTERTLLSFPSQTPASALLLSLTYALCHRPVDAALRLLDVFVLDPSAARSDIAPVIFEDLFIYHLIPVLQWFQDQRDRLLSKKLPDLQRSRSTAGMGSLSRMSGGQAAELKQLEAAYEEVVDENVSAFAQFLKEVLEGRSGGEGLVPPPLVLAKIGEGKNMVESSLEDNLSVDDVNRSQGRYNPMWNDELPSAEFHQPTAVDITDILPPPPQRVSPTLLSSLPSSTTSKFQFERASASSESSSAEVSSCDSEPETKETNNKFSLFDFSQSPYQKQKQQSFKEPSCSPPPMADSDQAPDRGKQTPPKDFVCPITSHLFIDPVTLETGQTYERRAIQEWLDRGNSTCPITRQKLQSTQLPKTNYVLKRLIASWKEQNPGSKWAQPENPPPKPVKPSSSPTSVISQAAQATMDGALGELRTAITNLCTSDILEESEKAVLQIEQFWQEASTVPEIQASLSRPAVINGFVEILFNSIDSRILRVTVFLLSELASREDVVVQTLTRVDSDLECVVALFKKGLLEAVVLIYLLGPSWTQLVEMDMVEALVRVVKKQEEDMLGMCLRPETAAVVLLGQIVRGIDEIAVSKATQAVVSEGALECIIGCLEAELMQERVSAVGILLRCMEEDGNCRKVIADKADLSFVLESFVGANDGERFEIVSFLSELVKLNRRTLNEQLLHIIKEEGSFSTMHTLLIYLQSALQDQCPVIAGLLLQLDLLTEPRKMSIYREEAIDALISCLRNAEFPGTQIAAAETLMALQGRFSSSGKPLARAYLLKRAGLERRYRAIMRGDHQNYVADDSDKISKQDEEKVAEEWEKKMAFVLVSHEFGLLFEALSDGLNSKYAELSRACFESATWLVYMLTILPDTGVRGAARVCLLKRFISIFKSARDPEDKALAVLALKSFMDDPEGLQEITINVKGILKSLREIKKSSVLASEMIKELSEGQDSTSMDLWTHKELTQVDCSSNGEVLCITCYKDRTFSGHVDGTMKVWKGKGNLFHLSLEVREHFKAVTSLLVQQSGEKLYSGSLDKTVRIWSIGEERIQCIQLYDMKDQVHDLAVANSISCFISQGAGVKVQSWNGGSKLLNSNKHVKCLALLQGKLYCGCSDSSIQEIDLVSGTLSTIQTGSRKLLSKAHPICALQVHNGLLYSASSSLDGAAVKIWSVSNYNLVGSLPSSLEIRSMAISSELIYLGGKNGVVEMWSREKQTKVGTLHMSANSKVISMAVNDDEDELIVGTSDGRIQTWGLT